MPPRTASRTRGSADANAALRVLSTDLSMAAGGVRSRPGPLAHLVRQHGRALGEAAVRRTARRDRPLAGAAATLEGRAARWRLPGLAPGPSARRTKPRTRSSRSARACGPTCSSSYPALDPAKVHVVYNGIDTEFYRPDPATDVLERIGVDLSRPYVAFVGRITRQKGVPHLLRAGLALRPGPADRAARRSSRHPRAQGRDRRGDRATCGRAGTACSWSRRCCPARRSGRCSPHALAFLCPSVYEPLGIVNLEAMACETAVVASRVGGIPEVVLDGRTGLLVDYDAGRPRRVREGSGRGREQAGCRSGARGGLRQGRARPRRQRLRLGRDRRADGRVVRVADLTRAW